MKCPNCSSHMFVADQNATSKSLVKFYRCSNCIGEHVSSHPLNDTHSESDQISLFASNTNIQRKQVSMI
jgi:DNA-directed RNA polymerase subunit RPC12/RpoP